MYLKDGHKSQHKTKSHDKMTATLLTNTTQHSPSELTAVQFVKKLTVVMEPQGSVPSILILCSSVRLVLPSVSFPQVSPPKHCIQLSSPYNATFPTHLNVVGLITLVIFGEEFK